MAQVTAQEVQALRKATGAGMMDAKRALEAVDGDFDAAVRRLREEGKAKSLKRADREASQGAVALVVDGGVGVIVELRCETDFVAKSMDFVSEVEELAALVAAKGTQAIAERSGEIEALAARVGERIEVGEVVRFDVSEDPQAVVQGYLHVQNDRGVNAVLVELEGGSSELAHELAVHIAFARPTYLRREDVPEAEVAAERETLEAELRRQGREGTALAKALEGRLTGWFKERCLLEQPYVRDEKQTISQLLGGATVRRYAQVVIGS